MSFSWRLAAVAISYALASLVMPLVFLLYEDASIFWRGGRLFFDLKDQLVALVAGTIIAAIYGALPAVPLIVVSELTERRGWTFSILGGALVGTVMFAIMQIYPMARTRPALDLLIALIVAGSLGGAVYRLVMGLLPGDTRIRTAR
ncbi:MULTISPECIES: hypothetical protein [Mesorhizobium]|nr:MULTISPECIES: hypothetical protein [Mesorhizobium]QKC68606.1 hypothetical protein EB815_05345 [Mesorhizobium loti]